MAKNPHFTSAEVVQITGITPRQLQWWDEQKIVVPARSGRNRAYTPEDLAELAVMCELRRKGFSLQQLRRVVRFLKKEFGRSLYETASSSVESHPHGPNSSGPEYHLLADGHNLFLRTSATQVVDLLKNASQPLLAVCLSDAVTRVRVQVEAAGKKQVAASQPQAVASAESEKWIDKFAS